MHLSSSSFRKKLQCCNTSVCIIFANKNEYFCHRGKYPQQSGEQLAVGLLEAVLAICWADEGGSAVTEPLAAPAFSWGGRRFGTRCLLSSPQSSEDRSWHLRCFGSRRRTSGKSVITMCLSEDFFMLSGY